MWPEGIIKLETFWSPMQRLTLILSFYIYILLIPSFSIQGQEIVYVQTSIHPMHDGTQRIEERGHILLPLGDQMVEKRFVVRYMEQAVLWNGKLVVGAHAGAGGPWFWSGTWGDNAGDTMMDDAIGRHVLSQGYAYASFDRDGVTDVHQGLAMTNSFTRFVQKRLRSAFDRPVAQTYLVGMSDGGAIARFAAESADAPYNGIMIIAGKGGDPGKGLERKAAQAGLWPQIDPRVIDDPDKVTGSVRKYADVTGTPIIARKFWIYGGVHANLDDLRRELGSMGLNDITDKALQKFSVNTYRKQAVFMGRLAARTPTGRIRMPTIELVGTYDDVVLREVLAYKGRVKNSAPDRHRLYRIEGAWHISGDDESIESFIIQMRQKGVGVDKTRVFWDTQHAYRPYVQQILKQLDAWVVQGIEPPEDRLYPGRKNNTVVYQGTPSDHQPVGPSVSLPFVLHGKKMTDAFKKMLIEAPKTALAIHNSHVDSDHLMLTILLAHNQEIDVALYYMGVDMDLMTKTYEIKTGYRIQDAYDLRRSMEAWWHVNTRTPIDGEKTHKGRLFVASPTALGLMIKDTLRVIPREEMVDGVILREGDGGIVSIMEAREFQTLQRGRWMVITQQPVDGRRLHEGQLIQQNQKGIDLRIGNVDRHIPVEAIHLMTIKSRQTEKNLPASPGDVFLTEEYYHTLKAAALEAEAMGNEVIDVKHLFLALTKLTRQQAAETLSAFNVDYEEAKKTLEALEH